MHSARPKLGQDLNRSTTTCTSITADNKDIWARRHKLLFWLWLVRGWEEVTQRKSASKTNHGNAAGLPDQEMQMEWV
jgi:hypothetical protein